MNWLDIVLLILVAGSVASSLRKGLTREIVGLVSVILALLLGTWFYGMAGAFLLPYVSSPSIAKFAGFVLVFGGVMLLGSLVSVAIGKVLRVTGLSIVDHLMGAAFGFLRGMVIAVALVMAIMAFAPGDKPPNSVVNSRLTPYVVDAAQVAATLAPHEVREGVRKSYRQVENAWSNTWKKGIRGMQDTDRAQEK
jgi:membrane protein required for colicin V production